MDGNNAVVVCAERAADGVMAAVALPQFPRLARRIYTARVVCEKLQSMLTSKSTKASSE